MDSRIELINNLYNRLKSKELIEVETKNNIYKITLKNGNSILLDSSIDIELYLQALCNVYDVIKMKYKHITYNNKNLVRISAKKVNNLINSCGKYNGLTIYTLPVNANPDSIFIGGFFELEFDFPYIDSIDLFNKLSEIKYYNCSNELGNYLKYYIEEK